MEEKTDKNPYQKEALLDQPVHKEEQPQSMIINEVEEEIKEERKDIQTL